MESMLSELLSTIRNFHRKSVRNKLIVYGASLLSLLSLRYVYCKIHRKLKSLPPGPIGLPIFGSLFAFGLNQKHFLSRRFKTEGEISCFYFSAFAKPILLLNSPETADYILSHQSASNRSARTDAVLLDFKDPQAFIDINGDEWKCRRRVWQRQLLASMANHKFFQNYTKKNIAAFFKSVDEQKNDVVYPMEDYDYIAFMNVYQNTFSGSVEKTSTVFKELSETIIHFPAVLGVFVVLQSNITLPLWALKWLDKRLSYTACFLKQWKNFNWSMNKFIGFTADVQKNQLVPNSEQDKNRILNKNPNECVYIEYLIKEYYKNDPYFDCRKIMCDITISFVTGVHSTSITAAYMTHMLSQNMNVQQQIYNELSKDDIENGYKWFNMSDVSKMSTLRAFVHECIRLSAVAKTGVPRIVSADMTYKNYILPKGSTVFINMDSCSFLSNVWGVHGMQLDLSHWLDKDKQFVYNKNLSSFGFGERECAGKLLAIKALLYLCANIVLNYKIYPYDNEYQCKFDYSGLLKAMRDPGFRFEKRL